MERTGVPTAAVSKAGPYLRIGNANRTVRVRENNEDATNVSPTPDLTVCIVADGMGGKAAGDVASKRAVELIPGELVRQLKPDASVEDTIRIIRKAIVHANEDIICRSAKDQEQAPMGTTVVLAVWPKGSNSLFVTGVGDSRAYLLSNNAIEQLTVDHSLAQALVEAKTISAEEAKTHRFRNVLWKYLGSKEVGEGPEVRRLPVRPGNRFLLCTDGLHGVVADNDIRLCMNQHPDAQKCADALCELARDSGTSDHVTCIVIDVMERR